MVIYEKAFWLWAIGGFGWKLCVQVVLGCAGYHRAQVLLIGAPLVHPKTKYKSSYSNRNISKQKVIPSVLKCFRGNLVATLMSFLLLVESIIIIFIHVFNIT